MKQTIVSPSGMPTANLAINKSRIKLYNSVGSLPTYYLEKDTEFQIELFNPTSDTVLAKIELNGNAIAQGGLVLRPGQRVFLERYLDIAKKFKFDTYEVSNTAEVRKAIAENGDLKVQFFRESKPYYNTGITITTSGNGWFNSTLGKYHTGTPTDFLRGNITSTSTGSAGGAGTLTSGIGNTASYNVNASNSTSPCMDSLSDTQSTNTIRTRSLSKKSIETGRVETGSHSNQEFQYVDKSFDYYAFHTVEYKMLPVSQKVNTTEDLNVKRYCSNCGAKHKNGNKFCPTCGNKA